MSYKDKEFDSKILKAHSERAIQLLQLSYPAYVTREEMAEWLGMGDRNMRAVLSYCKQNYPIISSSKCKGYKLVVVPERDMEEMINCWNEIDSRINELDLQRKQLIKIYEEYALATPESRREEVLKQLKEERNDDKD